MANKPGHLMVIDVGEQFGHSRDNFACPRGESADDTNSNDTNSNGDNYIVRSTRLLFGDLISRIQNHTSDSE